MGKRLVMTALCVPFFLAASIAGEEKPVRPTVEAAYPGLVTGVLSSATVGELPYGVVMDLSGKQVTQQQLDAILAKAPAKLKEQLARNGLFLAQDMATPELLLRAAQEWAATEHKAIEGKPEPDIISDYLQAVVADVTVSDAEIREFYDANPDMFSGAKLGDVKETLGQYLRKTKRQEKVDRHIIALGGKYGVVVSASWLEAEAPLARDNPVDKARASGKPTMVDFGATGCTPCEMMAPILKTLEKKYPAKANILFVHVGEEQVLAARYGVGTIPLQVFFNKDGKEVYRHVGFFAQDKIEAKFAELGVK